MIDIRVHLLYWQVEGLKCSEGLTGDLKNWLGSFQPQIARVGSYFIFLPLLRKSKFNNICINLTSLVWSLLWYNDNLPLIPKTYGINKLKNL